MKPFATANDLSALWRPLTTAEHDRAEQLLPLVSDSLREEAHRVGIDLDDAILERPSLGSVAKSVTVDVTARALMTPSGEAGAMTQVNQSALGYSMTGTFLVPGGGLFIKKTELARLGLRRQRIGVIEPYAARNTGDTAADDCGTQLACCGGR